jgi:Endonuclease I
VLEVAVDELDTADRLLVFGGDRRCDLRRDPSVELDGDLRFSHSHRCGGDFRGSESFGVAFELVGAWRWHREYEEPVTTHERHRNAAAFDLQQNRNPLVDLPELAVKADFGLAFAL